MQILYRYSRGLKERVHSIIFSSVLTGDYLNSTTDPCQRKSDFVIGSGVAISEIESSINVVKHVKLEKFSTVVETLSISKPMAHI